jgi:hypothetical protein
MDARQLALQHALVDMRRHHRIGHDACLRQQRQPPRAFTRQNEQRPI